MHRQIVVAVSAVLFVLLATTVWVLTTIHDRSWPHQLGATSAVDLDFASSELGDADALATLGRLSDEHRLGLVKLAPDLGGDQSGQVFVSVGSDTDLPATVQRFGSDEVAPVRTSEALESSFATGQYLVTGSTEGLTALREWLETHAVGSEWTHNTLGTTLQQVARQGSFAMSVLAATALMVALVLYWLSTRARGRALRSLGGISTWRIQYEDLGGFLICVAAAALVVATGAAVHVGFSQGTEFVPVHLSILATVYAVVIAGTMAGAVAMSLASWPSPAMLAHRIPAVVSLRKASTVLKAAIFTMVLASVAPAVSSYRAATNTAEEQAQWRALADQVVLSMTAAIGESGFQEIMGRVGDIVRGAEEAGDLALSYTWDADTMTDAELGGYEAISLVSEDWLDLVLADSDGAVTAVPAQEVSGELRQFLDEQVPLWLRDDTAPLVVPDTFEFREASGHTALPLSRGGNGRNLLFADDALLLVVPEVHATFDDDFLSSAASTGNLVFRGLAPTQALVERYGVASESSVRYVAEEGILMAQFAAAFAWLQGASLVALVVALVVSALVAAFVTAVLQARRDFPLRLAGQHWYRIVAERVTAEWLVGAALAVMLLLLRGFEGTPWIVAAAGLGLVASPLAHVLATRWTFGNVSRRRL